MIIVSDAQAVPRACPGGGYLLVDPLTGARRGGWLVFDDELLEASQRSTVAIQEGADPFQAAHDLQLAPMEFEVAWLLSTYPELRSASWRFDC